MAHEDEFHEEEEDDLQLSNGSIVQVHSIGSSITGELSKDDVEHREATTRHGTFKVRGMSFKKPLRKIARKVWRRVKPMLCKTRTVFLRKKESAASTTFQGDSYIVNDRVCGDLQRINCSLGATLL
jgi:hypothetical protein